MAAPEILHDLYVGELQCLRSAIDQVADRTRVTSSPETVPAQRVGATA